MEIFEDPEGNPSSEITIARIAHSVEEGVDNEHRKRFFQIVTHYEEVDLLDRNDLCSHGFKLERALVSVEKRSCTQGNISTQDRENDAMRSNSSDH